MSSLIIVILGAMVFLVYRSLRTGRGDRRSAWRLACYASAVAVADWIFDADHPGSIGALLQFIPTLLTALGIGAVLWALYLVVEPYARRYWPHSIISWTRVFAGRFRDPLVGRDLLFGAVAGSVVALGRMIVALVASVADATPPPPPLEVQLDTLLGGRQLVAELFGSQMSVVGWVLLFVFLLLLRIVCRRGWLAIAAFCVALTAIMTNGLTSNPLEEPSTWVSAIGSTVVIVVVLVRLGLLAIVTMSFTASLLVEFPATLDMSHWYAGSGLIGPLLALVIAVYGCRVAMAGQPLFKDDLA